MAEISPSAFVKLFNFNVANPVEIALSIYYLFVAPKFVVAAYKFSIFWLFKLIFVPPLRTYAPSQFNDEVPFYIDSCNRLSGGTYPVLGLG